jgi:3-oxoadipate enol-lactonase
MIGYTKTGSGPLCVIVLNDWMSDTSTWDDARKYLDTERFTWVLTDLRGYGRSRGQAGEFTLKEAATDVLEVAEHLGFRRFAIVGHSMSSLVALHLAQHFPERIERAVVLTPPPPTISSNNEAMVSALQAIASADNEGRFHGCKGGWGERLSDGWIRFKMSQWSASSDPIAVAAYVPMFARNGLPSPTTPVTVPLLAVTGEQDTLVMRRRTVEALLSPLAADLVVVPLTDCGHYPMQEAPPLLVAILERFLRGESAKMA